MRFLAALAALLLAGTAQAQVSIEAPAPRPAYYTLPQTEFDQWATARIDGMPDALGGEADWMTSFEHLRMQFGDAAIPSLVREIAAALCGSREARARLDRAGLSPALRRRLDSKIELVRERASRSPNFASVVEAYRNGTVQPPDFSAPKPAAVRLPERTLVEASYLGAKPEDFESDLASAIGVIDGARAFVELKGDLALPATLQRHLDVSWTGPSGNVNTVRTKLHLDAARTFAESVRKDPDLFGGVPNAVDYMLEGAKRATAVLGQTYVAEVRQSAEAARTSFREAILGLFAVDSPLIHPYTAPLRPFGIPRATQRNQSPSILATSADYALLVGGSGAIFQLVAAFVAQHPVEPLATLVLGGITFAGIGGYFLAKALRSGIDRWKMGISGISLLVTFAVSLQSFSYVALALLFLSAYSFTAYMKALWRQVNQKAPEPVEERHVRVDPEINAELEDALSSERKWQELEAAEAEAAEKEAAEKRRL